MICEFSNALYMACVAAGLVRGAIAAPAGSDFVLLVCKMLKRADGSHLGWPVLSKGLALMGLYC